VVDPVPCRRPYSLHRRTRLSSMWSNPQKSAPWLGLVSVPVSMAHRRCCSFLAGLPACNSCSCAALRAKPAGNACVAVACYPCWFGFCLLVPPQVYSGQRAGRNTGSNQELPCSFYPHFLMNSAQSVNFEWAISGFLAYLLGSPLLCLPVPVWLAA